MKKMIFLAAMLLHLQLKAQIISISTGINNNSGSIIGYGTVDDTWKVSGPGITGKVPAVVSAQAVWPEQSCGRWVAPPTGTYQPPGNFTYETTFDVYCPPQAASIIFNWLGADNEFMELRINNQVIAFNFPGIDDLPLLQNQSIPNILPYLVSGINTLQIVVRNRGTSDLSYTKSGMYICGRIVLSGSWPNNPQFTISVDSSGNSNSTVTANPVVTNANAVTGFGEMYIIERMHTGTGQVLSITSAGTNPNPPCWWIYPYPVIFKGYNGTQNVTPYSNCHLSGPGLFPFCYRYRITRGTWNAYCPWAQYSVTFKNPCYLEPGERNVPAIVVDNDAPDFSHLKPGTASAQQKVDKEVQVYPNPGRRIFTITTGHIASGKLELYNPTGKLMQRIQLQNNNNTVLDLAGYAAGTYIVKIIAGKKTIAQKLVLAD
jgi:Secretion system C-terminal sorting domain